MPKIMTVVMKIAFKIPTLTQHNSDTMYKFGSVKIFVRKKIISFLSQFASM